MINSDDVTKEYMKRQKGSGSGKTNALFNLTNEEPDIDEIYLYAKDPYETKNQFLINKSKSTVLKSILMILKSLLYTQMI